MDIYEEIKKVVIKQLNVKPEEVTPEASFIDDLGADSLDTVELIMALEERFDIEVPDEDAEKMYRVSDVVSYIENKKIASR
ncbi:acyl carrier protein [Candidatus Pacearchaeota archaeon CG1_02_35_32]|nr:MAG: acyl carrier protein [Candidatus Pacearchaeota archaeon CG1_02_35_32]